MLSDKSTHTTIPTSDLERANRFYMEALGLKPEMVTEGGVMFASGETRFFVYPSRHKASGHVQMSWQVADIRAEAAELRAKGVEFVEFDLPGIKTVDGIAQSVPNVWTAWFHDPDGNLLGLTQID